MPRYFYFDNDFCLICSGFLFGHTHHPHNVCLFLHSTYNSHRFLLYFCINSKLFTLLCSSPSWIYVHHSVLYWYNCRFQFLKLHIYFFSFYSLHFPFPISVSISSHFSICLKSHVYFEHFLKFSLFLNIYFEMNAFSLHILSHALPFRYVQFITWTTMKIFVHLKFLKERENLFLPSVWTLGLQIIPNTSIIHLHLVKSGFFQTLCQCRSTFLRQITNDDQPSLLSVSKPYRKLQKRLCSSLKKCNIIHHFKVNDECYMEVKKKRGQTHTHTQKNNNMCAFTDWVHTLQMI